MAKIQCSQGNWKEAVCAVWSAHASNVCPDLNFKDYHDQKWCPPSLRSPQQERNRRWRRELTEGLKIWEFLAKERQEKSGVRVEKNTFKIWGMVVWWCAWQSTPTHPTANHHGRLDQGQNQISGIMGHGSKESEFRSELLSKYAALPESLPETTIFKVTFDSNSEAMGTWDQPSDTIFLAVYCRLSLTLW